MVAVRLGAGTITLPDGSTVQAEDITLTIEPKGYPALPPGVRRCVGAFRRPCVILTDAILCPSCQRVVDGMKPERIRAIANGPTLTRAGWERASWWTASPLHRYARHGYEHPSIGTPAGRDGLRVR